MSLCLVTGGAGFIGSHLVEALLQQGQRVRVLDNLATGRPENLGLVLPHIDFIEGDIRDEAIVHQAMSGVELVFHLAAMVSAPQSMAQPREAESINTLGTLTVLEAARAARVSRLILSSTCAIYGDEPTLPKIESMLPQPKSPYAISKLAAEQYCQLFAGALNLETVVLRYFNVFGPRQDPASPYSGVISIFVDRMSRGLPVTIFGSGEQTRDFVFVSDVVRANLLAAQAPEAAGQLFNIGTGRATTINQLFVALSQQLHYDRPPLYHPARPGDVFHSYAHPGRAAALLGWQSQVKFDVGLKTLIDNLNPPRVD